VQYIYNKNLTIKTDRYIIKNASLGSIYTTARRVLAVSDLLFPYWYMSPQTFTTYSCKCGVRVYVPSLCMQVADSISMVCGECGGLIEMRKDE
jgi:hypothetical protein